MDKKCFLTIYFSLTKPSSLFLRTLKGSSKGYISIIDYHSITRMHLVPQRRNHFLLWELEISRLFQALWTM